MGYLNIKNLYAEQDILLFKECYALEKIHGSSAHVSWNNGVLGFFSGESYAQFLTLFDQVLLTKRFTEKFGTGKIIIYGEAYGGKCQAMSDTYGKQLKFAVFDVRVEDSWLDVPNAEGVATAMGLEFVSYNKISTDLDIIDKERDADSVQAVRNGMGEGHLREGVVLRPLIELTKNNGKRVIAKHKGERFSERRNTPKVLSPDKLTVLTEATAIAEEWVVPVRLEHILQELPHCSGMEHTPEVVRAMIADVYKEAKGEIVESKEVARAIGKKTAELWKKRLCAVLSS